MSIECCFCRGGKAVELKLDFPLCQMCVEYRDFIREWAATKEQHGLDPAEYGLAVWQAAQETASAAVH